MLARNDTLSRGACDLCVIVDEVAEEAAIEAVGAEAASVDEVRGRTFDSRGPAARDATGPAAEDMLGPGPGPVPWRCVLGRSTRRRGLLRKMRAGDDDMALAFDRRRMFIFGAAGMAGMAGMAGTAGTVGTVGITGTSSFVSETRTPVMS